MIKRVKIVLLLILSLCFFKIGFTNDKKDPYKAARDADLKTLRELRFLGIDLFTPDEKGFIPYEIAALNANPRSKESLNEHAKVMLWLKQYKPKKHVYGKASIKLVQSGLNILGYEAGRADGLLGKKTIEAIKSFQKDNDFPETGRLSSSWLGGLYKELTVNTQRKLLELGYNIGNPDGLMGSKTIKALEDFRSKNKLSNSSYPAIDADTIIAISKAKIEKKETKKSKSDILLTQSYLKLLGYSISTDGIWGKNSKKAVESFQNKKNIPVTGIVDKKTEDFLKKDITKSIQRALTSKGFDTKGVDGKWGRGSISAANRYQKANNISISKDISDDLIISLASNSSKSAVKKKINKKKISNTPKKDIKIPKTKKTTTSSVSATHAKGAMTFIRKNRIISSCNIAEKSIPLEWCEPFYPLPKKNYCEATFKEGGGVINLWCK